VLRMIQTVEENVVPVNLFQGELFCSRFGIHIDAYENPEGHRALFGVLDLIDGTRSIADLAEEGQVGFAAIKGIVDELRWHNVVSVTGSSEDSKATKAEPKPSSRLSDTLRDSF